MDDLLVIYNAAQAFYLVEKGGGDARVLCIELYLKN